MWESPKTILRNCKSFTFQRRLTRICSMAAWSTLQTSTGTEKSRRKKKGQTRTASCANASLPRAQETRWQQQTGAVSGRKDGNRGAGNTLAKQQDWTERRSSTFGGKSQCVEEQRKSCSSYRLANVTTLPTAIAGVTRTRWLRQHAIDVATQKVHPGGKKRQRSWLWRWATCENLAAMAPHQHLITWGKG